METEPLPAARALSKLGIPCAIVSHDEYGRKAESVAPFFGIRRPGIAKTLTFITESGRTVIVALPKTAEVDERALAAVLGEPARLAKASEALQRTGMRIGGVTPIGGARETILDESLRAEAKVMISAGDPELSAILSPEDLLKACGPRAKFAKIAVG